MIVLSLDTTGPDCSVSIVDDAVVLAHIARTIGRGHAEVLAGFVEQAFARANLNPSDIDRLAVCTGPGSFTGLRVALSFAKGFAMPRSLPVVGINAMDVTAQELWLRDGDAHMSVYRDIRRGEVFYCEYKFGAAMIAPKAMSFEEAIDTSNEKGVSSVELFATDTRILAWLAIDKDPEDYPAEPLYSRGPDAKLPGGKNPPKRKA